MIQAAILSKVQQLFTYLNNLIKPNTDLLPAIKAQTDLISPTGSVIKTIQTGTISSGLVLVSQTPTSWTNTSILSTAVTTSKAYVIFEGLDTISGSTSQLYVVSGAVALTNTTTVTGYFTAQANTGGANYTFSVRYTVVEFN